MLKSSESYRAYFALFVAIIAVSTSAILVRLSNATPGIIAFYRLFFTVVLMLPLLPRYLKSFKSISVKVWVGCAVAGLSLAFHFILWFQSLELTSVASSVVLVTLQPLFAFVGTVIFFKERYRFGAVIGALLSILGSVIISWGDFRLSSTALVGDCLALAACAVVTIYLMIGQQVRQTLQLYTYTFIVYSFSLITLFIYNLIVKAPFTGYSFNNWVWFVLLAALPTLLGHTLFNWTVKFVGVTTISMGILGEPIGASILAYFIFGETLRPMQIFGSLVILIGIGIYLSSGLLAKTKTKVTQDVSS
ncbi:MAG TPA: DMT family transporter [Candidatus Angelobacter sp.]|nr:DMT family transporter [Candidatus Angelobacter sp.]